MKAGLAGAALAAVMACGWAAAASAAPLSFNVTGIDRSRGNAAVTLDFFAAGTKQGDAVTYTVSETYDDNGVPTTIGGTVSALFDIFTVAANGKKDQLSINIYDPSPGINGQAAFFNLFLTNGMIDAGNMTSYFSLVEPFSLNTAFITDGSPVAGYDAIAPVPLPSAAPLFGVALLGLGVAGRHLRRGAV